MYKNFFGLSEAPFSISPNPKFFYLSKHHREALSMLKHGTNESGGFIVFTGEVGTGKTVILRTMMQEIDDSIDLAVIFNPALSLIELLETICHEFHIDFEEGSSKRVLLQKISDFLTEGYKKGRRALLMIDEAQHLSDDSIEQVRLLTNIETDNTKLLQVILVGQPELQQKFRQPHMRQVAQRITARFHLLPLSIYEVDSYVRFRMQSAGCLQVIFNHGAIKELYRVSGGIPRIINVCCDRALLAAYVDHSHFVERRHMVQAVHEVMGTRSFVSSMQEYLLSGRFMGSCAKLITGTVLAAVTGLTAGYMVFHKNDAEMKSALIEVLKNDPDIAVFRKSIQKINADRGAIETARREQTRYRTDILNSTFEEETWKKLLREWGFANATGEISRDCDYLSGKGYRCFAGNGNLNELEKYNVPVVLSLLDDKLRPFYAVLLKLNDRYARLLINNREWIVTRDFLNGAMEGSYRLIWPLPNGEDKVNRYSNPAVQTALFDMLNRYENTDTYVFNGYDKTMQNRVKNFQENNGLSPDGMAGIDTLWALLPYAETGHPLYEEYIAEADYHREEESAQDREKSQDEELSVSGFAETGYVDADNRDNEILKNNHMSVPEIDDALNTDDKSSLKLGAEANHSTADDENKQLRKVGNNKHKNSENVENGKDSVSPDTLSDKDIEDALLGNSESM